MQEWWKATEQQVQQVLLLMETHTQETTSTRQWESQASTWMPYRWAHWLSRKRKTSVVAFWGCPSCVVSNRAAAKSPSPVLGAWVCMFPTWHPSHEKRIQWSKRHLGNINKEIFMNYYYREPQQEGREWRDLLVNIFSVTVFMTRYFKNSSL